MNRQTILESTKREVLTEAGFRCAVPTCRTILTLDIHHMVEVSEGGGNETSNLLCLCPNCHALYHRQDIPRESIRVWKSMLVALNEAFDKSAIDKLIFLNGLARQSLSFSGDGVLQFSKLIASGLAEFQPLTIKFPNPFYEVFLTDKGRLLVEAWLSGQKDKLEKAMSS